MSKPESHLAINPAPFRDRAVARRDDPEATRKEKALADALVVMCDRYDELRRVFGVEAAQIVRWPGA